MKLASARNLILHYKYKKLSLEEESKAESLILRGVPVPSKATCQRMSLWSLHSHIAFCLLILVTKNAYSVKKA